MYRSAYVADYNGDGYADAAYPATVEAVTALGELGPRAELLIKNEPAESRRR